MGSLIRSLAPVHDSRCLPRVQGVADSMAKGTCCLLLESLRACAQSPLRVECPPVAGLGWSVSRSKQATRTTIREKRIDSLADAADRSSPLERGLKPVLEHLQVLSRIQILGCAHIQEGSPDVGRRCNLGEIAVCPTIHVRDRDNVSASRHQSTDDGLCACGSGGESESRWEILCLGSLFRAECLLL